MPHYDYTWSIFDPLTFLEPVIKHNRELKYFRKKYSSVYILDNMCKQVTADKEHWNYNNIRVENHHLRHLKDLMESNLFDYNRAVIRLKCRTNFSNTCKRENLFDLAASWLFTCEFVYVQSWFWFIRVKFLHLSKKNVLIFSNIEMGTRVGISYNRLFIGLQLRLNVQNKLSFYFLKPLHQTIKVKRRCRTWSLV